MLMAIGVAVLFAGAPASVAHDSRVADHGSTAGTAIEAEEPPIHQGRASNSRVFVAEPIGRVRVGPRSVDGEPIYVRRTVTDGITIVEISTTPFMPVVRSGKDPPGAAELAARKDQLPASW